MNYNEYKYKIKPNLDRKQDGRQAKQRNRISNSFDAERYHNNLKEENKHIYVQDRFVQQTMNPQQLYEQVQELLIIRNENNKELIKLETELQNEKMQANKLLQEQNELIEAMNDLTTK